MRPAARATACPACASAPPGGGPDCTRRSATRGASAAAASPPASACLEGWSADCSVRAPPRPAAPASGALLPPLAPPPLPSHPPSAPQVRVRGLLFTRQCVAPGVCERYGGGAASTARPRARRVRPRLVHLLTNVSAAGGALCDVADARLAPARAAPTCAPGAAWRRRLRVRCRLDGAAEATPASTARTTARACAGRVPLLGGVVGRRLRRAAASTLRRPRQVRRAHVQLRRRVGRPRLHQGQVRR